jgi:hypothetical protein
MSPLRLSIERGGGRAVSKGKAAAHLGYMLALSLSNEMGSRSGTKNHNLALMLPAGSHYITNPGRQPTKSVKNLEKRIDALAQKYAADA